MQVIGLQDLFDFLTGLFTWKCCPINTTFRNIQVSQQSHDVGFITDERAPGK